MSRLTKAVTESDTLRKVAIPAYRVYARAVVFHRGPRVLANSQPKSGTHLVASLLKNLPEMMFSGHHYSLHNFELPDAPQATERHGLWRLDWERVERTLRAVNKGQFMTAHFAALPELLSLLDTLDYKIIATLRDPRDVAVSSAFYITGLKRHFLYDRFHTEFITPEQRLMATITGFPPKEGHRGLGSIANRVRRYMAWHDDPNTYVCRFENLVGSSGGGSDDAQRREVAAIARHVDRELPTEGVAGTAAKTWSATSSTFRKGAVGDWKNHFTEAHKTAFKDVAGDELIELGYEKSRDW